MRKEATTYYGISVGRRLSRMQRWVLRVKIQAENKCEICGKTENLTCHHILPQNLYPEHKSLTNNGILLCEKHHKMMDKINNKIFY